MDDKKRIKWIDVAKGVGILLVMISHFSGGIPFIGQFLFGGYMQMFFVISGFTLKINNNSKDFLLKRAKKLLIPYFVYGFLIIILNMFMMIIKGDFNGHVLVSNVLGLFYSRFSLYPLSVENNKYLLNCFNSPFWFLTAMFVSYIWVWIYFKQKNRKNKIIVLVFLSLATILLVNCPILLPWSIDTSFIGALFIITGYYIKKKKFTTLQIIFACILYCCLILVNGNINMSVRDYGRIPILSCLIFYGIGILFTIIYCCIIQKIKLKALENILSYIGNMTIVLLCFHLFLAQFITLLLQNCNIFVDVIVKIIWVVSICSIMQEIKRKVTIIYEKKYITKSGTGNNN